MDIVFLLLALTAFVVLLTGGVPIGWVVLLTFVVVLLYMSLRYPSGAADWKAGARESLYMLFSVGVLLILVYVMVAASRVIVFPEGTTLLGWVLGVSFGIMLLAGLAKPEGWRG